MVMVKNGQNAFIIRPNEKISVFPVTKILGRAGTHIFLLFFSGKIILRILIFFFRKSEKVLGFTCKFR